MITYHEEFSEDFNTKIQGKEGIRELIMARLKVKAGEIPYFSGGFHLSEFTYNAEVAYALKNVLPEFSFSIDLKSGKIVTGDISIDVSDIGTS